MKSLWPIALIAASTLAPAVLAGEEGASKGGPDPDRMICKTEEQIGSRLAKKKVCMTAAQWKEQRRLSRMEIDRTQAGRYKNN